MYIQIQQYVELKGISLKIRIQIKHLCSTSRAEVTGPHIRKLSSRLTTTETLSDDSNLFLRLIAILNTSPIIIKSSRLTLITIKTSI